MKNEPRKPSELERRLDVGHQLPPLKVFAIGGSLIVALILWVWPSGAARRGGWSGGPVTNHHKLIEGQCELCHPTAFGRAPDGPCVPRHAVHAHAPKAGGAPCASCHREHHGEQRLIPEDSPLCTNCHRERAPDFAHHPEFTVEAWSGEPPRLSRVKVGDKGIRDANQLKFSHTWHLALEPKAAQSRLTCDGCHAATADGKSLAPVSYAQHCASCHPLELDDALSGARVPHGASERVYDFVRGAVSQLHLERGQKIARGLVDRDSREIEAGLFTQGGACVRCHDVESVATPRGDETRYRVQPRVVARWMPAAAFEHPTHRFTACERCHAGIRDSRSAGDVLMPSIEICRECHADPGTAGKVDSPCLQCHAYHPKSR